LTTSYEIPLAVEEIEDANLRDFLSKCLDKNPDNRLSIDELLQHDWLIL
jgi:serine/threonine protein kinase